jgi:Thioredoxin domain-containing protein
VKTIIKLSMTSCIPCQQLKPIFEDVVGSLTDIKVVDIDVEEHPEVARNYQVKGVPSVIVTDENDNILAMKSGMMSKEQLKDLILRC